MAFSYSRTDLERLARDAGISNPELPAKLPSLVGELPRNFKILPVDDERAQQILDAQISGGTQRKPSLLTRKLSKRRASSYTFKNATAALSKVVEEESAGVVQALLELGGDATSVKNRDTKCTQADERARLLITAVRAGKPETVSLLAPASPQQIQNEALAESLAFGHIAITSRLLQHNADPNYCKLQFVQAVCNNNPALVSLFLRAPTPLNNSTMVDALTSAVKSESLRTVKLIVEAVDLSHEQRLSAVEEAVYKGKIDCLLAILPRAQSLSSSFLDNLVLDVLSSNTATIATQTQILEALFYAGARGDKSAAAFVLAVERQPIHIDLFAKFHIDINWGGAKAVRGALRDGDSHLVRRVLKSGGLNASSAAQALKAIPRYISSAPRLEILRMLLEFNPRGAAVDEQLVFAVKDHLDDAIVMLRQHGASIDANSGDSLIEAIKTEQVVTVRHLLTGAVDPDVLRKAFPYLRRAGTGPRRDMTRLLLEARAAGEEVNAALRDAVCDQFQDVELIDILLEGYADPTYRDSQSIRHAISSEDLGLLRKLLRSPAEVSSNSVSTLVADVMQVKAIDVRYQMLQELIESDPTEESLSCALSIELQGESHGGYDSNLVDLLLTRGNADPNFKNGKPVCSAVLQQNDEALRLLTRSPRTTRATRRNAVVALLHSQSRESMKAARLPLLINVKDSETIVLAGLRAQLDACQSSGLDGRRWPLECFRILLGTNPNVELDGGDALKAVINSAALPLLDLLLSTNLSEPALQRALMHCLTVDDKTDRFEMCKAILQTRLSEETLSVAFFSGVVKAQADVCEALLGQGAQVAHRDHAGIKHAASVADLELLRIILQAKPMQESLSAAFCEAQSLPTSETKLEIFRMLLAAGLENSSNNLLDHYLVKLVEGQDLDTRLVQLMLDSGASVEFHDSRSALFAATSGKLSLLQQLWPYVKSSEISTRCFGACLSVGHVEAHRIDILQFLLQQGARGPLLDDALFVAVDCLANRSLPLELVGLLLSFGADPDSKNGLALCRACETGRVDAVEALVLSNSNVRCRSGALHHVLKTEPHLTPDTAFCQLIDHLVTPRPWDLGFPRPAEVASFSSRQAEFNPVLRVLLGRRPEGVQALGKVLNSGFTFQSSHDFDILAWAIRQTAPIIDLQCIQLLVERGANSSFIDEKSGESLIMIAIRSGKSRLLQTLIRHHADVSQKDKKGRSPLLLAVQKGDSGAVADLLVANPTTDDGSLHQAVRTLNFNLVKMLLEHNHDAMLPSPYQGHARRTPLAELICSVEATTANLDQIREVILLLQRAGANITKRIGDKPLICVALDKGSVMAEAILRAYLSKLINEDFNLYWCGRYCYSPTTYVRERICEGPPEQLQEKLNVLKDYGADKDVFYANTGRQPQGAVGVPEEIWRAELRAQQEEEQLAREEADHRTTLRRRRELALEVERANEAELNQQLNRTRAVEAQERQNIKQRHDLNRALKNEAWADDQGRQLERQRMLQYERHEELKYQAAHAAASLSQTKQLQSAEQQHQAARDSAALAQQKRLYSAQQDHHKQIQYLDSVAQEKQTNLLEGLERKKDSYHASQHEREMKRLTMASAVPVGRPYMLGQGNSQRAIGYH